MNATVRSLPRPQTRETDLVRSNELVVLLLDALVRSYRFSARERAILGQMLLNRPSGAIARALQIRETTVHKHMHAIFARTKTADRRRLFDLALRLAARQTIVAAAPRLARPQLGVAA